MSVKEVLSYRIPQFLRTKLLMRIMPPASDRMLEQNADFTGPRYSMAQLQSMFARIPFHHNYELFHTSCNILEIDNWRQDIHSGKISPIRYFGSIQRQDYDTHGDVKITAEISRFHFLPFMALEYASNPGGQSLSHLRDILSTWNEQNPFLKSIHWTSGIEVGIRSVNLIYTHHILKQFGVLDSPLDLKLCRLITRHYDFLRKNLSLYSSANNHLMAELSALTCISSYFLLPQKTNKGQWEKLFYDQVLAQVHEDGVHMELCTHYHSEVLDHILIAISFLENARKPVPEKIWQRCRAMFDFVSHSTYEGIDCIFGDNDEGSIINPYFDENFSLYSSQLATANHIFKGSYQSRGEVDFRNYLIYGSAFQAREHSSVPPDALFPDAGYFFSYDHDHKMKLAFDVGEIGDSVSAAHGHSDIFHFTLAIDGQEFLIDPGTYQYHTRFGFWRDYFRGITSHNTISVNGKDHGKKNGRMSWIDRPEVWITNCELEMPYTLCAAKTTAFNKEGILHSRAIHHNKSNQRVQIQDTLEMQGKSNVEIAFYLHIHPDVEIDQNEDQLILTSNKNQLIITNEFLSRGSFFIGNEKEPLGWYSPYYGVRIPIHTFRFTVDIEEDLRIQTEIEYS